MYRIIGRYHVYEGSACRNSSGEVAAAELAGAGKESGGDADAEQVGTLLLETGQCPESRPDSGRGRR